ncbi:uncharacterized protein UTRI_05048 [Ustilago trichophora]|uniref:Uncharacterized protein n=1 Tax=Ustilago trichophora TaxID=86804 RepID=A0A5C3ECW9_9BASI|nr:uncharacterized protein UTRI_05048 [Ustilago trichophora]
MLKTTRAGSKRSYTDSVCKETKGRRSRTIGATAVETGWRNDLGDSGPAAKSEETVGCWHKIEVEKPSSSLRTQHLVQAFCDLNDTELKRDGGGRKRAYEPAQDRGKSPNENKAQHGR